jgi:hypothetical protein
MIMRHMLVDVGQRYLGTNGQRGIESISFSLKLDADTSHI